MQVSLIPLLIALCSVVTEVVAQKSKITADSYINIGYQYSQKGEHEKALESYQKGLQINLTAYGEIHPDVAKCYSIMGYEYSQLRKYDQALECYQKVLKIRIQTHGATSNMAAIGYRDISNIYLQKGEYDKAIEYCQKELQVKLHIKGDVASCYRDIGYIYSLKGEYDKALGNYQKGLEIRLKGQGGGSFFGYTFYNDIGYQYFQKKDYNKALENYQKALENMLRIQKNLPDFFISKHFSKQYALIGYNYSKKGDYNKALENYQKALEVGLNIQGKADPDIANYYTEIGYNYSKKGEADKALEYHQKALEIRLKKPGKPDSDIVYSYSAIGYQYLQKEDYDKALENYQKALEVELTTLQGKANLNIAKHYADIGYTYSKKKEYDSALEYHQKALEIRLKKPGKPDSDIVYSYSAIGYQYLQKEDYDKALENYQKALEVELTTQGIRDPAIAKHYADIGYTYSRKGEYDKALENHQKALEIRLTTQGEADPAIAKHYADIGYLYFNKGEHYKALEYLQMSLHLQPNNSNNNVPESFFYMTLAGVYTNKIDHDRAVEYYQKELQRRIKKHGETHPNVAKSYSFIGFIYLEENDYEKALEYCQKALKIMLKTYGKTHSTVANCYFDISKVYNRKRDYDKALEFYQKVLKIRLKNYGKMHTSVANCYTAISETYAERGDYDKALEYSHIDLQIKLKILGVPHPHVAETYNIIGNIYLEKDQYDIALQQYQKAILANVPYFQDTLIEYNPSIKKQARYCLNGLILIESFLSKAFALEKKFTDSQNLSDLLFAYQTYCSADTLAQQIQRKYTLENDKVEFVARITTIYQQSLSLCLKLYDLTQDKSYLDKAFYFAGRGKASVLSASLAEINAKTIGGIPDSLLALDKQLQVKLSYYEQKITEKLYNGTELTSSQLTTYQDQLFTTRRKQDSLVHQFEQQFPSYHQLKYKATPVSRQQLQQQLDHKTANIEYVIAGNKLHQLILTSNSIDIQTVVIDRSFHRMLAAFRNSMRMQKQDIYKDVAFKLYQLLWPKNLPAHIEQVIIIPDGVLATVPFDALLVSNQMINGKLPYLLEKYTISYAYSASLLYENLTKFSIKAKGQLLALAPVFANKTTNTTSMATRDLLIETTRSLALAFPAAADTDANDTDNYTITSSDITRFASNSNPTKRGWLLDNKHISALPASEQEVQAIEKLFTSKQGKAKVYLHEQAREEVLKSKDLDSYNYLHLATHGFVNATSPELSGLLLAQDSTSEEDGILYAGEIYNLNLQAELVTLSACETGLGKLAKGEGIIGLTRALLYAGARNVAVSLWKVADESTSELMQAFYKRMLDGESKARALQGAKLEMLANKQYAHPYFWAPFILIGK